MLYKPLIVQCKRLEKRSPFQANFLGGEAIIQYKTQVESVQLGKTLDLNL